MKRILLYLFLVILTLSGCSKKKMNMNTVLDEPNFTGIVTEVYENLILVNVNEDEAVRNSSDLIAVSLNVEIKDGLSDYNVGDEVRVYYDGTIAESYPAQVMKVYAITIVSESDREREE